MKNKLNFAEAIEQLTEIATELENDKLPLEESLKKFENGIKLIRECETTLKQVEQKINVLVENNGDFNSFMEE